ncbi:hypothetical protein [Streptacidiphilus fuscans]|uniref:Peptidase inhibitor family I36 n=1 Tax=Streptacidiphilus fuscans TaxID=2789292 RepID=A0A931FCV1_9ACTN|nr:hypothetical protein [Streptacidiphilus fuscans]MBF9066876.1 hypothetical protein [Streptacidiphilus fuscans]
MRSRSLKALAVMATVAAIGTAGVGTANAASQAAPHTATQAAPFATQVREAGLNTTQAAALQSKVDQILHQYTGAKQVAANEIALPHGSSVLLPLPGQKYARVLPGAVNLGFAPANATRVTPNSSGTGNPDSGTYFWPNGSGCTYEYFCMWQGQEGAGEQFNVSTCNEDQELPGSGWNTDGSWINNQTPGTDAYLLNSGHGVIYTTPPPMSWNNDYNWQPVWYADACNH